MKELHLQRVNYAQVGTTGRGCMRLLPAGANAALQKVVVATHNGVLMCFDRRNDDTNIIFKTLPLDKRIECMTLGGALGSQQDRIFFATGNTVRGVSKKGKQFFNFDTNLTDSILNLCIYGVDMFVTGTCSMTHYQDCVDVDYYMCGDRLNSVLCLPDGRPPSATAEGGQQRRCVLAADDHRIAVLVGGEPAYHVPVGDAPVLLKLWCNTGGPEGILVAYGCRDGRIGLVQLPVNSGHLKWELPSANSSAAVAAIDFFDVAKSGVQQMIVGKDDGTVEVYSVSADGQDKVELLMTHRCDESITSLECGYVSSKTFPEIVICTYTGWVFGLCTEPQRRTAGSDRPTGAAASAGTTGTSADGRPPLSAQAEARVEQMKQELDELQQKVAQERDHYHEHTNEQGTGVSAVPVFAVNDRFTLLKEEASYMLTIELVVPIDYALLQCDVPIDLLDVERNSAVVSLTRCEPNSGNALLATYRCQANTTRLDIKIRSIEGQHGTLVVYVSPKTFPKVCQKWF